MDPLFRTLWGPHKLSGIIAIRHQTWSGTSKRVPVRVGLQVTSVGSGWETGKGFQDVHVSVLALYLDIGPASYCI